MYGDFVMMVDAQIGRVLAALEKANLMQDTLLIFASDNGPVWFRPMSRGSATTQPAVCVE
jgi:arylsulfatase A